MYKKITHIILSIIICLGHWSFLNAQNKTPSINFKQITTQFGLSDDIVKSIIQDEQGFMWFGTGNGLNRYDGYTFKHYYFDDTDSASISNNSINYILKKNREEIWLGTFNGLNAFNIRTEKSKRYKFKDGEPNSLSHNYIFQLIQSEDDNLWIATGNGLNYLDIKTDSITRYNEIPDAPKGIKNTEIWSLALQGTDSLWIGTDKHGLYLLHIPSKKFTNFSTETGLPSNNVSQIFCHTDGYLLIGHWQSGLSKFNPATNKVEHFQHNPEDVNSIGSNLVNVIFQDNTDDIWIGLWGGGINLYNSERNNFSRYSKDNTQKKSIINNDVNTFYQDETGLIWIGTWGGISYFDISNRGFYTLDHTILGNDFSDYTKCIFISSKNELWIGTEGDGLYRYDSTYQLIDYYSESLSNEKNQINSNYIYEISEDREGNIWVGSWDNGINVIHVATNTITSYAVSELANQLSGKIIYEIIHEDDFSWIATSKGINKIFHTEDKIESYPLPSKHFTEDKDHPWIYALELDDKDNIWVGTDNGLFLFDKASKKYATLLEKYSIKIADKFIKVIRKDTEGNIWVATSKGIHRINKERNKIKTYDKSSGLSEDNIQSFEIDSKGTIWVSTYRGISNIQPQQNKIWNYSANNELQANQFNVKSSFKDKKGNLYFGGIEGINYFNPSSIGFNSYPPKVSFTNLKVFNKSVMPNDIVNEKVILKQPINYLPSIELSHLENIFTIEFVGLHFSNPEENSYQYRLIGLSEQWTSPSKDNFATFTNLSEGTYQLEVKAANSNGIWNNEPVSLTIIITPPWWKASWFVTILLILFLLFIYSVFYWRSQFFKKQKTELRVQIDKQTLELRLANVRLENQKKEIVEQNKELQVSKEELTQQHEELKTVVENLKNTQSKLVQAEKMAALGQLTAGIAHEINNPVNFINSGIVGLKKGIQQLVKISKLVEEITPENIDDKLEEIHKLKKKVRFLRLLSMLEKVTGNIEIGAQRTAEIVKGLRTFSRQDSEKTAIIDIHEGIDSTLVLLHNQYKNKLKLIKNYGELPMVECYPGKINQVFMNLISNAIDAIEPNGEGWIKISTETIANNKVKISIEDNGKGMTADLQEKIFEPFFTTKEVGKGTGLGLSITIGIINDHHGDIEIDSVPGEGTAFHLYFPVKQNIGIEKQAK